MSPWSKTGAKQGDPLSPILFNCIIEWAIEALDPELGVRVGGDGPRLNHLAFADDIVLMARSKIGIQHLSQQLERTLGLCGLTLNPDKSRSLTIAVDGKAGRWVCAPTPYVSLTGGILSTVPISEGYKYLGITVSAREGGSSAEELLSRAEPSDQSSIKAPAEAVHVKEPPGPKIIPQVGPFPK